MTMFGVAACNRSANKTIMRTLKEIAVLVIILESLAFVVSLNSLECSRPRRLDPSEFRETTNGSRNSNCA